MPTASARDRTHAGTAFCAATFIVDIAAIHAMPPTKSATPAATGPRVTATAAETAANPSVAVATTWSLVSRSRIRGSTSAPTIAPAPRHPSRRP